MIEVVKISHHAEDYASLEAFDRKYSETVVRSLEAYAAQGHGWCWCLVGNIVQEHLFGEEHEIRYGTKQFSGGTKVYLSPAHWGDGYENIVVIGMPRSGNRYIEVVTRSKYIENYRMKMVFKPAVLKRMCESEYRWWGDTDEDRKEIIAYLETRNPAEAERQKALLSEAE